MLVHMLTSALQVIQRDTVCSESQKLSFMGTLTNLGKRHMTTGTGFAGETWERWNGSFLVPTRQTNKAVKTLAHSRKIELRALRRYETSRRKLTPRLSATGLPLVNNSEEC